MASLARRRGALQAADELLNDLAVDQESPIDVFDIIDQLGLRLVFNPLNALLGVVVPKGDGGIMLTTQRRPAVQRYTAAHEIGHWILDIDQPAFDTEDDIFHPSVDRERLAQLFAGQLLMPPPLVFATCSRHGISDAGGVTGPAVYLAARDMGASYEAAARQMANLGIIDRVGLGDLLSLTPAKVKKELCHGHRPTGPVDVWPVDNTAHGGQVHVTECDELFVALPENRTTGYRWLTADELRTRSERQVAPPPAPFAEDHPGPDPAALPEDRVPRPTPAAGIKRALSQIPGDADARRTLPEPDAASAAEVPTRAGKTTDHDSGLDASATSVHPPELQVIEDRYEAGWAAVRPAMARSVRRAIAGRRDLVLPEAVDAYRAEQAPEGRHGTGLTPSAIPVAATGYRLIALRCVGEGTDSFDLSYTSAIDPQAPIVETFHLDVVVSPPPQVQHRRQLLQVAFDDDAEPVRGEL